MNMGTTQRFDENGFPVEEIRISVPWGHVAGKAWGDKRDPYVLTFHGLQDNAGSFDRLIPNLPVTYYYVCFDLPGHGKSSHFPPHLPVHTVDYILCYKIIADHFAKKKYIIMGHSYGGQIGALFTRLYPEFVEKLILLDTLTHLPVPSNQYHSYLKDKFETLMDLNEKLQTQKPPTYTFEEALNKVINQRHYGELSEESGRILLRRNLIQIEDGKYQFSLDPRMRCFINPLHDFNYALSYLKKTPFQCPVLIILGTDSQFQLLYMKPIIKFFEANRRITVKYIPGHHDVHMNNPELVAKYVSIFLSRSKNKL